MKTISIIKYQALNVFMQGEFRYVMMIQNESPIVDGPRLREHSPIHCREVGWGVWLPMKTLAIKSNSSLICNAWPLRKGCEPISKCETKIKTQLIARRLLRLQKKRAKKKQHQIEFFSKICFFFFCLVANWIASATSCRRRFVKNANVLPKSCGWLAVWPLGAVATNRDRHLPPVAATCLHLLQPSFVICYLVVARR